MGEYDTRTVTLTNRSPVPLYYSISKSMSISSGFLNIPQASESQGAQSGWRSEARTMGGGPDLVCCPVSRRKNGTLLTSCLRMLVISLIKGRGESSQLTIAFLHGDERTVLWIRKLRWCIPREGIQWYRFSSWTQVAAVKIVSRVFFSLNGTTNWNRTMSWVGQSELM